MYINKKNSSGILYDERDLIICVVQSTTVGNAAVDLSCLHAGVYKLISLRTLACFKFMRPSRTLCGLYRLPLSYVFTLVVYRGYYSVLFDGNFRNWYCTLFSFYIKWFITWFSSGCTRIPQISNMHVVYSEKDLVLFLVPFSSLSWKGCKLLIMPKIVKFNVISFLTMFF